MRDVFSEHLSTNFYPAHICSDWAWSQKQFGLPAAWSNHEVCSDCYASKEPGDLNFANCAWCAPWTTNPRSHEDFLDSLEADCPLLDVPLKAHYVFLYLKLPAAVCIFFFCPFALLPVCAYRSAYESHLLSPALSFLCRLICLAFRL